MHIQIGMIKINSIDRIGSLNIGKTIICRSEANDWVYGKPEEEVIEDDMTATGELEAEPVTPVELAPSVEPVSPVAGTLGTLPPHIVESPIPPVDVSIVPPSPHPVPTAPPTRSEPPGKFPDFR